MASASHFSNAIHTSQARQEAAKVGLNSFMRIEKTGHFPVP